MQDFRDSLRRIRRSVSPASLTTYEKWNLEYGDVSLWFKISCTDSRNNDRVWIRYTYNPKGKKTELQKRALRKVKRKSSIISTQKQFLHFYSVLMNKISLFLKRTGCGKIRKAIFLQFLRYFRLNNNERKVTGSTYMCVCILLLYLTCCKCNCFVFTLEQSLVTNEICILTVI